MQAHGSMQTSVSSDKDKNENMANTKSSTTGNKNPTANWLQDRGARAQKRTKLCGAAAKLRAVPSWELDNTAAKDGVYFDKEHQTYEIRQYGKDALPLSGKPFYNRGKKCVELYDDLSKPPLVVSAGAH
jgi:hypothetical protein